MRLDMPKKGQIIRVKRQPQRTCVGCKQVEGKRTLIRLVRRPDGIVEVDPTGRKAGRGAYVHQSLDCIEQAIASNALSRSLKANIGEEVISELRNLASSEDSEET